MLRHISTLRNKQWCCTVSAFHIQLATCCHQQANEYWGDTGLILPFGQKRALYINKNLSQDVHIRLSKNWTHIFWKSNSLKVFSGSYLPFGTCPVEARCLQVEKGNSFQWIKTSCYKGLGLGLNLLFCLFWVRISGLFLFFCNVMSYTNLSSRLGWWELTYVSFQIGISVRNSC